MEAELILPDYFPSPIKAQPVNKPKPLQESKPIKKRKKSLVQSPIYRDLNEFKKQEKHYKYYQYKQTDFSNVYQPLQYQDVSGYQVCSLKWPKGTYIVRNFNTPATVLQTGLLALNVYCKRPYRTNLDKLEQLYQEQGGEQNDEDVQGQNQPVNNLKEQQKMEIDPATEIKQKGYSFNDKIRWANVGYQYDWTNRKYPSAKTEVHPSISKMSIKANDLYNTIKGSKAVYEAESAIINYYGEKDYMTGHLDDAQIDQTSPIYSFSFGLSCIFLIGGPTKDQQPVAIRLNSGDLMMMSGDSRQSYHGVPRILKESFKFSQDVDQTEFEINMEKLVNKQKQVRKYFGGHRVNINIRQVYPKQS